jgi:serine/threonine protein kinase
MLTLDGYRIAKRLSATSHSEVYAAVCEQDDLSVVLKLYSDSGKRRAERELDCTQRNAGVGVPRVIEIASAGARPVLVLERIHGATNVEQLERGPLAVEDFLAVAVSLAEILARVHAARILHRDIKPQNVLIDAQSRTWLIDFGCAATLGSAEVDAESKTYVVGTLPYMAPEATGRMGRGVDARSDLHSLGATFYHLLTGRPPFVSRDVLEPVTRPVTRTAG